MRAAPEIPLSPEYPLGDGPLPEYAPLTSEAAADVGLAELAKAVDEAYKGLEQDLGQARGIKYLGEGDGIGYER